MTKISTKSLPIQNEVDIGPRLRAIDPVAPPARPARAKKRHWMVLLSFLLMVCAPAAGCMWYLLAFAADQYASTVAFSVRREETSSPLTILEGIGGFSGSSSSDADILYEFLQSQRLVQNMDMALDLRKIWSGSRGDIVFAFDTEGAIEDLVDYWARMVKVHYDSGVGLIEVQVRAFNPNDANLIALTLFDHSVLMINDLSAIGRADATRYAGEDLDKAIERLKGSHKAITQFRNLHQIIDPRVDLQTQAGLLGNLQTQLAEALIDADLLTATTRTNDPRIHRAQRRVVVIEDRIEAERRKLGIGAEDNTGEAFADIIGEFEGLEVDREFAETAYVTALATYDGAVAEARRKSRYLAAHIKPTLAETARYPERFFLTFLISLFLFLIWAITVMVAYSLRERR